MNKSYNTKQSDKDTTAQIMIYILSNVISFINGESGEHLRNVKKVTEMLLQRLMLENDHFAFSRQEIENISLAAALHDIGKVGIDPAILNKPCKMTDEEYEEMKKHTLLGEQILCSGELSAFREDPLIKTAMQVCRWHHERIDGKGYPDGLSGGEIPLAAQVVGIADVYDALVSKRCYKKGFSSEKAIQMIESGECGRFDPILVESLKEISGKLSSDVYMKE